MVSTVISTLGSGLLTKPTGWTVFGIQASGYCFSGPDAENTYQRYGMSDRCLDTGEGGVWANQVYRITGRFAANYLSSILTELNTQSNIRPDHRLH